MLRSLFILLLCLSCCYSNIHRSISGNHKHASSHQSRLNYPDKQIEEIEDDEVGWLDGVIQKGSIAWLYAIPASILVGSTGIFPLLIFYKCQSGSKLNEAISPGNLRLLLSFSVGGLFGDVFLHLLPEAWMYLDHDDHFAASKMGLWIISGLLCFFFIEKIFSIHDEMSDEDEVKKHDDPVKSETSNGHANGCLTTATNGVFKRKMSDSKETTDGIVDESKKDFGLDLDSVDGKKIIGYLNLLANCIDNFTHGLAVGGSFIVSIPVGLCTTFAILLHEIPHEIGDFAILLKAGFDKWEAAKGQVITASGALIGCLFGLMAEGAGDSSSWVLPFTSGGFIYISCVTIIPDLLKENRFKESVKQMAFLFAGIGTMGIVSFFH